MSALTLPQLLVSVRDAGEAAEALKGGCTLLDVKEPLSGPLGMAGPDRIREIASLARNGLDGQAVPCSAALGELRDWQRPLTNWNVPSGVTHVKVGPSGLASSAAWRAAWAAVRKRVSDSDSAALHWVAVAYADWHVAECLPPLELLSAAILAGCDAFLIDTYRKDGKNLFESIGDEELAEIALLARRSNRPLAVAGSLSADDLGRLAALCPEIVAIRGAACDGGRLGRVTAASVRRFRRALVTAFASQLVSAEEALPSRSVSDAVHGTSGSGGLAASRSMGRGSNWDALSNMQRPQ